MNTTSTRYTTPAVALHWLLALLITASFCLGLVMTGLEPSPDKLKLYNWHKWAGVVILTLSAARLLWRLMHRPPADPQMASWQRGLMHATHGALYVLFFAVPLAGWAYSSAAGYPVVLFGVLPLPDFVSPDKDLAALVRPLHRYLAYTLALCVLLHLAGVLKHQWIDRDNLLARMRWHRA